MVKLVVWDHGSEVRFFHPRPEFGDSSGLRFSLARRMSRRVRLPRSPPNLDLMCQLPAAGMKFPNSIGERSGLDSHCCPPT